MTAKAARPADHADRDSERAAAVTRLTVWWERQAARLSDRLDLKAIPDVSAAFDFDAETAALTPVLRAVMQRVAEVGAWDVLDAWNPTSDGWDASLIEAYIAKAAETNAGRWNTAVHERLAAAIVDDPASAADTLRAFLSDNALAIALAGAFVTGAMEFGGFDAAKKSGLRTKTWYTTSRNPRPAHAAQNGTSVDIDDVFANGLRWPGDHYGTAADNANCSCRLEYGP